MIGDTLDQPQILQEKWTYLDKLIACRYLFVTTAVPKSIPGSLNNADARVTNALAVGKGHRK